ncbi:hypothetical protein V2W45_1243884, partial [Cenococcum geophilum]
NIKRQLSGDKFSEDIKATLESSNNRLVKYKRLIKVIITLPSVLLEDKIRRRNNTINAVIDYCNIKEGRLYWQNYYQKEFRTNVALSKVKIKEDTKILKAVKALERAKSSLYKEKRLKIYFICLGNKKLIISKRIYKFYTLAALIKHF